jgi:hypothetical protein
MRQAADHLFLFPLIRTGYTTPFIEEVCIQRGMWQWAKKAQSRFDKMLYTLKLFDSEGEDRFFHVQDIVQEYVKNNKWMIVNPENQGRLSLPECDTTYWFEYRMPVLGGHMSNNVDLVNGLNLCNMGFVVVLYELDDQKKKEYLSKKYTNFMSDEFERKKAESQYEPVQYILHVNGVFHTSHNGQSVITGPSFCVNFYLDMNQEIHLWECGNYYRLMTDKDEVTQEELYEMQERLTDISLTLTQPVMSKIRSFGTHSIEDLLKDFE